MAYPQLKRKIEILDKKFGIDPAKISLAIEKDKSTAWRWLTQQSERLRPEQQAALVDAICKVLGTKGVVLTDQMFRGHNPLKFCLDAGLTKLEAAHYNEMNLPVPEVLIDSLFDFAHDTGRFSGHYLQYRIEREFETKERPYLQVCVVISLDEDQRIKYETTWRGSNSRASYEGFLFFAGTQVSVIGQCINAKHSSRPEAWWCALRPAGMDGGGKPKALRGYTSDFTPDGSLYTDRIVLAQCTEEEQRRVSDSNEIYVDRKRLIQMAGKDLAEYLDAWRNVPI
jgi:hypothetical protein